MGRIYGRPSKLSARPAHRIKSEAPLNDQIRYASPSNPEHQRRMRALHGLLPNSPSGSEADEAPERPNDQMMPDGVNQRFDLRMVDDAIRMHNDIQVVEPTSGITGILAGFKPPQIPMIPVVKLELTEEEIAANAALRAPTLGARKRQNNQNAGGRPTATAQGQQEPTQDDTLDHIQNHARGAPGRATRDMVIDLTLEDDNTETESHQLAASPSRASVAVRPAVSAIPASSAQQRPPMIMPSTPVVHTPNLATRLMLTPTQTETMDHVRVPQHLLQQANGLFVQAQINLSDNIKTWSDLKVFAAQHPIATLTPDIVANAQAHAFYATGIPPAPTPPPPPQVTTATVIPRSLPPSSHQPLTTPTRNGQFVPTTTIIAVAVPIKVEGSEQGHGSEPHMPTRVGLIDNPHQATVQGQSAAPPATVDAEPAAPISLQATTNNGIATDLQILRLTEPLNLCPELLPSEAPAGHPHLVQVWNPALVNLPQEMHDHLDLFDTVVSIIYRYAPKTRTAIKAFLDTEKIRHFFFLFKSRSDKCHSWSIEREGDMITIGIDRNQRAPNVSESERPSAGQYDLTIRYQLQPSSLSSPLPDPNTESDSPAFTPPLWIPIGTSIFPAQPHIATFLYNTPPNRGADDHERYEHPPPRSSNALRNYFQSSQRNDTVPPDRLSILARYFQTTAFTTGVMDAEFQVCWGHRVRYDAVIGRVRATFRNAIKGAATQAKRREAGDYNRPVVGSVGPPSATTKKVRERPGNGASAEHLRGEDREKERVATRGKKKKRSVADREMEEFVVQDDEPGIGERAREGDKVDEGRRKKMKREKRGSEEPSGSEYSASDESG